MARTIIDEELTFWIKHAIRRVDRWSKLAENRTLTEAARKRHHTKYSQLQVDILEVLRGVVDEAEPARRNPDDGQKLITIDVDSGCIQDVTGLPEGWGYQIRDWDECSDCGSVEPLCQWCREYYTQEEESFED